LENFSTAPCLVGAELNPGPGWWQRVSEEERWGILHSSIENQSPVQGIVNKKNRISKNPKKTGVCSSFFALLYCELQTAAHGACMMAREALADGISIDINQDKIPFIHHATLDIS